MGREGEWPRCARRLAPMLEAVTDESSASRGSIGTCISCLCSTRRFIRFLRRAKQPRISSRRRRRSSASQTMRIHAAQTLALHLAAVPQRQAQAAPQDVPMRKVSHPAVQSSRTSREGASRSVGRIEGPRARLQRHKPCPLSRSVPSQDASLQPQFEGRG